MNFLFWLFLIGILVASLQDLKRREVDNWLNLFLLVTSFSYLAFQMNGSLMLHAIILGIFMYILSNIFYYGRVFAGGDAKLLYSMTALFIGVSFLDSLMNVLWFVVLLMVSGSIYGIVYSLVIYFKNFESVNSKFSKSFKFSWMKYSLIIAVLLGIISYFYIFFIVFALLVLIFPVLYSFAKTLEDVVMTRSIPGKNLREGDWLAKDVRIGKTLIKSSWEGLEKKDLKRLRNKRAVEIKEGIPFVPAFLIAFLAYSFFREFIISLVF